MASALIRLLAWEPPYAADATVEKDKKKKISHFLFPSDLLAGASHWSNLTRSQRAREPVDAACTGQPIKAQSWAEKGGQDLEGQVENVQNLYIAL